MWEKGKGDYREQQHKHLLYSEQMVRRLESFFNSMAIMKVIKQ